jgi:8-hydroxy-5-deazaflavin:NADPH oxidoreductase
MARDRCCPSTRREFLRLGALAVLSFHGLGRRALAQSTPGAKPIRIGAIGAGRMGGTLGALWVKAGHPVMFSSQNPEEIKRLVEGLGPLARAGTVDEAVTFGDAVLLAVPYSAYPELGQRHARALAGKLLIDVGNAVPARDGAISAEAKEAGIGLTTAKYFPNALIVRAFNTLGYSVLQREANRPGERMAIPIAGDDAHALATAQQLVRDAGFDPVVIGGLVRASEFAQGAPLYGQQLTAKQMRERTGLGQ